MSTHDELACTYSALILVDDDVPITVGDNSLNTVCGAVLFGYTVQ